MICDACLGRGYIVQGPIKEKIDCRPCGGTGHMETSVIPTLRDQFAMAALTGLVVLMMEPSEVAAEAYKLAEAMLAERQKRNG